MTDPRTLHRTTDPDTSVEAAEAIVPSKVNIQARVLAFAKVDRPNGFTDVELNQHFSHTGSTYRTRRAELVAKGLIYDTSRRKQHAPSKRWHIIWRAKV